jgi:hypothetical protein
MNAKRIQYFIVAVGKKGIGKTHETMKTISEYVKGNKAKGVLPRKVLILDVHNEYTGIATLPYDKVAQFYGQRFIEARRILAYNPNGTPMSIDEIGILLSLILEKYWGGMLIIEDINMYITDNMPQDLIGRLCTNRHKNVDLITHYQSIGRITPKVWQNLNYVRFHKNNDSVDRHELKFPDKYEILKLTEIMVNKRFNDGDKYYFLYVDADNMKIRGAYTKAEMEYAIDEYIGLRYNKILKPIQNQIDPKSGNKKYSPDQAYKLVKDNLYKTYHP